MEEKDVVQAEQAENAAQESQEDQETAQPAEQPEQPADPLAELQQQLEEQKDLLLRTAAEYDNYKKRTQREKEELSHFTKCMMIKELLPALDNFQRASQAGIDNPDEYKKGMDMSIKSFTDCLEKMGLTAFGAPGDPFDPELHNAVSKIEDDSLGENCIAQVYQKGYQLGQTVVRHAMVVVANCN